MAQPVIQPSFAAGELAPSLYARVDLAKFHVGVAKARNFFIDYRGGASNRTGTIACGVCKQRPPAAPPRNIPFTFSTVQTYTLEFGDLYMRVVMNGGYVLEPTKAIVGITVAAPGVFNVTGHGYSAGDQIFVAGALGMTQVNSTTGFQLLVSNVGDANHFSCTDLFGNSLSTAAYAAYTGGGTVARVFTLVTPYAAADLPTLKFTQSADTMILTHISYAPQQLTRSQHWAWTIAAATFASTQAPPTAPSGVASSAGANTSYSYVITAQSGNNGGESLPTAAGGCVVGASAAMSATAGLHITLSFTAAAGAQLYNIYRTAEVPGGIASNSQLFGYIGSTSAAGAGAFVDANILPDFSRTPPIGFNPFAGNNPGCATYFQQRLIFAGSLSTPMGLWASRTGDFLNNDYASPSRANDGIVASIASNQVNAIKHLVSMNTMIALTSSGAWKIDGGQVGAALTPTSITAVPQSYNGCSDVPPIVFNNDILYVQAKGSIVRDLTYNLYFNLFTGSDITTLANHLFYGHQIVQWALCEEPFKIIWCVRDDGVLLSLTFLKDQDVIAWAHHDSSGLFKSVCSISEGSENVAYFVVERLIGGQYLYFQERMQSRNMGAVPEYGIPADLTKAWFVDCGLQYPLTYPNANLTPGALDALPTVVGVDVIAGGAGYSFAPTIIDQSGSGATFSAVVVGGVITTVNVLTPGANAMQPVLVVSDPTGSGAILQSITSRDVVMTADQPVFNNTMIGAMLRVNNGWGTVRAINSPLSVNVNILQPLLNLWPAAPNAWSCTIPVMTISGLDHLNGMTVAILADGSVMPQQVVANGGVVLQNAASAIVIGLPYVAQLRSLYLDIPGESPTVQGKRKKISALTVRVQDTKGLQIGHDFVNMDEFKERRSQQYGSPILPITGDQRKQMDGLYDVPGQLCLQQQNPLPATVLGWMPEVTIGDTAE